jgi:outer membrane protein OmpA-like peptidoglycan-associated protein
MTGHDRVPLSLSGRGVYFLSLESAYVLQPLEHAVAFGSSVINHPMDKDPVFDTLTRLDDPMVSFDAHWQMGLFPRYQIGVTLASVVASPDVAEEHSLLRPRNGLLDAEPNGKLLIFQQDEKMPLRLSFNHSFNIPLLDSGGPRLGSRFPLINLTLAAETKIARLINIGLNFGYRVRQLHNPTAPEGDRLNDEAIFGVGVSHFAPGLQTTFMVEGLLSTATAHPWRGQDTDVEIVTGLCTLLPKDLAVYAGVSWGLSTAIASGTQGFHFGVTYAFNSSNHPTYDDNIQRDRLDRTLTTAKENHLEQVPFTLPSDYLAFELDERTMGQQPQPLLDLFAATIREHKDISMILIRGHTDGIGGVRANAELARDRAEEVKAYFVYRRMPTGFFEVEGVGETEPLESDETFSGRDKNRRFEFVFKFKKPESGSRSPSM